MRTRVWCTSLVLASLAVACGDQPTEVVPERESMTQGPGAIALATSSSDDGRSITTDKDDYAPGDTVWFTGAGWPANDVLDVVLTDDPTHDYHQWTIDVGADGTFRDSTYVVDIDDLGVTFTLTATSRANPELSLTVTFTDNRIITKAELQDPATSTFVTLTQAPAAVVQVSVATDANVAARITATTNTLGTGPAWQSTEWVIDDGVSVVATSGCDDGVNVTAATVGATHTFNITAPPTAGTYRLRFRAFRLDGCTGSGPSSQENYPTALLVTEANQPPTVNAGGPYSGDEGSAIPISGAASDPDGDAVTTTWSVDDGGYGTTICTIDDPSSPSTTVTCTDNGTFTLTLSGTDGKIATPVTSTAILTVDNVDPVVDITAPIDLTLYQLVGGLNIPISADFTDDGSNDTHTCEVEITKYLVTTTIGSSITDNGASGSCSATLYPNEAAVYSIKVTIEDDDDGSGYDEVMVIVYDPTAGFVTGGGWIMSPYGAYAADPALTGKATFGFVSKYEKPKGSSTPNLTGNTEFVFHAAGFNFHSSSYEYLLVNANGTRAQFKGTGMVNGEAGYGFLLTALDGSTDKFRIKIWNASGTVYDNQMGKDDSGNDATALSGGSIVIHVPKK
jgi:hypothetical protein